MNYMTGSPEGKRKLLFEVEPGLGRIRLDEYLFARLGNLSRMYLRELVKTDQVQVNGEFANVGIRLRANDFVEVEADLSRGTAMRPENVPLEIVYEDEALIVVDKPAGMLVHPTHRDKNGTLLNALTFHLNKEDPPEIQGDNCKPRIRPGLIHRLDRETSGLIVVAKTLTAHRRMAREFMKKRIEKRYVARVEGLLRDDEGVIEAPIGRFADEKFWSVKTDGKMAVTRYRVLTRFHDSTLVELEPVTGRTNQLRIHCASIGHAIVGDVQRGGRQFVRLCLHACKLGFRHPAENRRMEFHSELPADMSVGQPC